MKLVNLTPRIANIYSSDDILLMSVPASWGLQLVVQKPSFQKVLL